MSLIGILLFEFLEIQKFSSSEGSTFCFHENDLGVVIVVFFFVFFFLIFFIVEE